MKPSEQTYSWDAVPALAGERIETGENALSRIDAHIEMLVHDWRAVGIALSDMQAEAMRQAGANRPIGKGYNGAWAVLAYHAPRLAKLDKATRSHAMWLAEHWDVVETWHANLEPKELRRMINHPATVHRRFDRDHPLPHKAGTPKDGFEPDDSEMDDEVDDDNNTEATGEDLFDIGDRPSAPAPETREDWLITFGSAWNEVLAVLRRAPAPWRSTAATRITLALDLLDDIDEATEVVDDIDREIAAHESREVRTAARAVAAMPSHGEPTQERLAQVVAEAEANPLPEGADIFAGLGDEVGAGQVITPGQVRARRPKLKARDASIIAAQLNHPGADDSELALYAGEGVSLTVVRRVLKANGFRRE